jgi:hypothetical protein
VQVTDRPAERVGRVQSQTTRPAGLGVPRHVRLLDAVVLSLLLVSGACLASNLDEATARAAHRVDLFHQAFNTHDCGRVYDGADISFRKITSREQFLASCDSVYRRVGPVRDSKLANRRVAVTASGRTLTLEYLAEFANGRGRETFVLRPEAADYVLIGYSLSLD